MEGLCDICGSVGRINSCMLCGRRVCSRCFVASKGVCRICLRGKQAKT